MTVRALALSLSLAAMVTGCASRHGLDVAYPAAEVNRALLASVANRRIEIKPVVDARPDTARIGSRAEDGKDVVTSRPVSDVVREALALEISRNGHTVVAGPGDLSLLATVEDFWLDTVLGYGTTQYVGKVVIAVQANDGQTGKALLSRRYVGVKRQRGDKSDDARRAVMDAALARAMHDLATDPALLSAFTRATAAAAPR
jgi:YajG family uncharacterized lipoprotein